MTTTAHEITARYGGELPDHFRLSPSASSRWLHCPDSAQCGLPESQNEAADVGRTLHAKAAELLLTGGLVDPSNRISAYVNFVRSIPGELHVECKFVSQSIFDLGGTIDALRVTDSLLHIVDLKTGKWRVKVGGNTQLMTYLVLAAEYFPGRPLFRGSIVQEKIKTAEFTANEIAAHRQSIIRASVSRNRFAGEWCRFCPLRFTCPNFAESGLTF